MAKSRKRHYLGLLPSNRPNENLVDEDNVFESKDSPVKTSPFFGGENEWIPATSQRAREFKKDDAAKSASSSVSSHHESKRSTPSKPLVKFESKTTESPKSKKIFSPSKNVKLINEFVGNFFDKLNQERRSAREIQIAFEREFDEAVRAYQAKQVDPFVKARRSR